MKTNSFRTFVKFFTSGMILNLIGLVLFSMIVAAEVSGQNASLIASIILLPFAFLANRNIVFNENDKSTQTKLRFVSTYSLVVACNYLYLAIVLQRFRGHELLAQLSFLIGIVLISFLIQKYWVFRQI